MVTQCVYCGAELSESPVASDQGGDSFSPCPQCGKLSGGLETTSATERLSKMARSSPADVVFTGQPFQEPYRLAVAIAGSLMLLFSAFCPLLQQTYRMGIAYGGSLETTTSLNLFVMQPGAATVLVLMAFLSIGMAAYRHYGFIWITVLVSLFILGATIVDIAQYSRDLDPGWGSAVAVIAMAMMLLSTKDRLPVRR